MIKVSQSFGTIVVNRVVIIEFKVSQSFRETVVNIGFKVSPGQGGKQRMTT